MDANKNVFISYGHNAYDDIVKRLANSIRELGYNVFFDVDYLHKGDWEDTIDNHIRGSKFFIFMISAKSVSKNGYCLNELCRSLECGNFIIPVNLDDSLAPLSINKYQRILLSNGIKPDGSVDELVYNNAFDKIKGILSGNLEYGYTDGEAMIKSVLKPISSKDELYRHYQVFKGRKKAFLEFEQFMSTDSNIWWLPSDPGTGKTAFSTMLAWNYPQMVAGIHLCKFNNSDRIDPKRVFATLAFQLSNFLPEYKEKLLELNELDKLFEKNAERIFEYLFIEPLHNINPNKNIALIIDALDEASFRGDNEICAILQRAKLKNIIPSWLKFILTSRREPEVVNYLNYISTISTQFEINTIDDIKEYYLDQFPDLDDKRLEILLNKSEGSFLYATEITKQVKNNTLSLDDINLFPPGIYGFFNDCFNRIFEAGVITFEDAKPVLEFLCIFTEVVTEEFLQEVLKADEYEIRKIVSSISGLFKVTNNGIEPIHKSLIDWLSSKENVAQKYYVSRRSGFKRLYDYLKNFYDKKRYNNIYLIKHFGKSLIELNKTDELEEMLNNYRFLAVRNKNLHFDTGLKEYLVEISKFDDPYSIFCGDTFIRLFEENRRLLYNSGMFFDLKKLGLTDALDDNAGTLSLEGEIGIAFYYYIVEEFDKAIKQCKSLINNNMDIKDKPALLAEVYNVKGLSERKLVEFDDAIASFNNAIINANEAINNDEYDNSDPEFELSMAYLILGKIYTNLLDFDKANESLDKAVEVLKARIDCLDDGDDKTAKLLFLAEEYRVYAYSCIWEEDFSKAESLLNECDIIYRDNKSSTDRYFLRYQYSSCLFHILKDEEEGIEIKLVSLLKNIKGKYDNGTINMYLGLLKLLSNSSDTIKYINESKKIFKQIKAYLELNEAQMVEDIYNKNNNIDSVVDYNFRNEYARVWIDYATRIINKLVNSNK